MIESFGNRLAEDLYFDRQSRATRVFMPELRRIARRKLLYLHDAATLKDLRFEFFELVNQFKREKKSRCLGTIRSVKKLVVKLI